MSSSENPPEIMALPQELRNLYDSLPAIVTREALYAQAPIYRPRTLANLDAKGKGPPGKLTIGSRACYTKTAVVLWLAEQIKE